MSFELWTNGQVHDGQSFLFVCSCWCSPRWRYGRARGCGKKEVLQQWLRTEEVIATDSAIRTQPNDNRMRIVCKNRVASAGAARTAILPLAFHRFPSPLRLSPRPSLFLWVLVFFCCILFLVEATYGFSLPVEITQRRLFGPPVVLSKEPLVTLFRLKLTFWKGPPRLTLVCVSSLSHLS